MIDPDELHRAKVLWGASKEKARKISVGEWLQRNEIDSLVALVDGHIVAEIYTGEMTPQTPHNMWCGAKSVITTAMAPYLADGTLDANAEVTEYVPEFSRTGFKGAKVRHLLDQTSGGGVRCREWLPATEFAKLDSTAKKEWDFGSPEFQRASHAQAW
jgi:CubicO group peptidase (beta-lactamase class C family)